MPGDMLAGLGLAETTPGPLILVLVFVAFWAARARPGLIRLWAAFWVERWRCSSPLRRVSSGFLRVRHISSGCAPSNGCQAGLAAITAAVVGVIANLAVWFALNVLFAGVGEARFGPLTLPQPDVATLNVAALAIALGAGTALLRFHVNLFWVLGAATLAGVAITVLV
jgi:chromate transporter